MHYTLDCYCIIIIIIVIICVDPILKTNSMHIDFVVDVFW